MSTPVEYTRIIPRLIYRIGVWIASRLGLYAERAEEYFNKRANLEMLLSIEASAK
jgi:hypothetical protein